MKPVNISSGQYRPDIDGLRGVCVTFVLLYHLGVGFSKGGFVGVDVFFVISGFLITSIINREIENKHFSLTRFYERRIIRLFPVLFSMMFAASAVAYIFLFPTNFVSFGKSMASAVLFVANLYFRETGGYFAEGAETAPLNHTWSLGVEEQYYLIFPVVFVAVKRWAPRRLGHICWIAAGCFLAISQYLTQTDPDAAFYLIGSRGWELLIGAVVALGVTPKVFNKTWSHLVGGVGLLAIMIACLSLNKKMPFPGVVAMIPCLGAAFVIMAGAGRRSIASKILSAPPIHFVGLISYSLYIWHYPIIAFYKYINGPELSNLEMIGLGATCLSVATFSYLAIERPIRKRRESFRRSATFALAAGAMLAALAISGMVVVGGGLPARFAPDVLRLANFQSPGYDDPDASDCFLSGSGQPLAPHCLQVRPGFRNLLLFGDSHASDLKIGFEKAIPGLHLLQATAASCKPIRREMRDGECKSMLNFVWDEFLPTHRVDGIIISANWSMDDSKYMKSTLELLARFSNNIIVVGPAPEYNGRLPLLLARGLMNGDPDLANRKQIMSRYEIDDRFRGSGCGREICIDHRFSLQWARLPQD